MDPSGLANPTHYHSYVLAIENHFHVREAWLELQRGAK